MESNQENENKINNEIKNDINPIKEFNEQNNIINKDINMNMKKISSNNDLEDEGKDIDFTGQILFKRTMGKKLCSVTLANEKLDSVIGVSIHDPDIIPKLKVGDLLYVKGRVYYHKKNPQNKNIQAEIIKILGKGPDAEKINNKRMYFYENKNALKL